MDLRTPRFGGQASLRGRPAAARLELSTVALHGMTRIADERTVPPGAAAAAFRRRRRASGRGSLRSAAAAVARPPLPGRRWPGRRCWRWRSGRWGSTAPTLGPARLRPCRGGARAWPPRPVPGGQLPAGRRCCLSSSVPPCVCLFSGARAPPPATCRRAGAGCRIRQVSSGVRPLCGRWPGVPLPRYWAYRPADALAAQRPGDLAGPVLAAVNATVGLLLSLAPGAVAPTAAPNMLQGCWRCPVLPGSAATRRRSCPGGAGAGGRAVAARALRRPGPAGARARHRRAEPARHHLAQTRARPSTPARPSSAGSSATCTTAPRPGWSRSAWRWTPPRADRHRAGHARELLMEARDASAQGPGGAARPGARHPPAGARRPGPGRRGPRPGPGRPLPVRVNSDLPAGPPAPVESAAYFAVASCSPTWPSTPAPGRPTVDLRHSADGCGSASRDDGYGGADPAGAPGCAASSAGSPPSTARSRSAAPPAARPRGHHGGAVRVVIAEDLFLLRDGLIRLLEAYGFEVAAAVDNGADLLDRAARAPAATSRWSTSGCRPRSPTRGCARLCRRAAELPACRSWCSPSTSSSCTPASCSPTAPARSATCSRTGCFDERQFTDAVKRVADGGTVMDPEVIARLLARTAGDGSRWRRLSPREREVLELMAEGRSNAAIAPAPVGHRARRRQAHRLDLPQARPPASDDDNRRVLAVLAYLGASQSATVHRGFGGPRVSPTRRRMGQWDMAWIDLEGAVNVRDLGGTAHRGRRQDRVPGSFGWRTCRSSRGRHRSCWSTNSA